MNETTNWSVNLIKVIFGFIKINEYKHHEQNCPGRKPLYIDTVTVPDKNFPNKTPLFFSHKKTLCIDTVNLA